MRMSPQGKGLRCEGSQPRRLKGMAPLAVVRGWYIYMCVCVPTFMYVCMCMYIYTLVCTHEDTYGAT